MTMKKRSYSFRQEEDVGIAMPYFKKVGMPTTLYRFLWEAKRILKMAKPYVQNAIYLNQTK
jgi:hypothetical protein